MDRSASSPHTTASGIMQLQGERPWSWSDVFPNPSPRIQRGVCRTIDLTSEDEVSIRDSIMGTKKQHTKQNKVSAKRNISQKHHQLSSRLSKSAQADDDDVIYLGTRPVRSNRPLSTKPNKSKAFKSQMPKPQAPRTTIQQKHLRTDDDSSDSEDSDRREHNQPISMSRNACKSTKQSTGFQLQNERPWTWADVEKRPHVITLASPQTSRYFKEPEKNKETPTLSQDSQPREKRTYMWHNMMHRSWGAAQPSTSDSPPSPELEKNKEAYKSSQSFQLQEERPWSWDDVPRSSYRHA